MDEHERTRTILWALCDMNPAMPLVEALGYLKAVEVQLAKWKAEADSIQADLQAGRQPTGDAAVSQLVKELSGNRVIQALARRGDRAGIAEMLVKHAGASEAVAGKAAESLVNLHEVTAANPWL